MQFIDIAACNFWAINPSNLTKKKESTVSIRGALKCIFKVYAAEYTFCRHCQRTSEVH